jgi:hypothetical protein
LATTSQTLAVVFDPPATGAGGKSESEFDHNRSQRDHCIGAGADA